MPVMTVSDHILTYLRQRILSGQLPLGSRLDQMALANELGVSLIPIRECLRRLEAEGLIRIEPRRGAFVIDLSEDDLRETIAIRAALEELATRRGVPNLTREKLRRLERVSEQMRSLAHDHSSYNTSLRLNRALHFTIYEAARAPYLLQLLSTVYDRYTLHRRLLLREAEIAVVGFGDHDLIVAACKQGDADAAARLMREHILESADFVAKSSVRSDSQI